MEQKSSRRAEFVWHENLHSLLGGSHPILTIACRNAGTTAWIADAGAKKLLKGTVFSFVSELVGEVEMQVKNGHEDIKAEDAKVAASSKVRG